MGEERIEDEGVEQQRDRVAHFMFPIEMEKMPPRGFRLLRHPACATLGGISSEDSGFSQKGIQDGNGFDPLPVLKVFGQEKIRLGRKGRLNNEAVPKREVISALEVDRPEDDLCVIDHRRPVQ